MTQYQNKILRSFVATNTDKGHAHGYHRAYNEIFSKFVPESILEIGVCTGSSLAAWRQLFERTEITGIDITDRYIDQDLINFAAAVIKIRNSTQVSSTLDIAPHDLIIDDGSHYYRDIIETFRVWHSKFHKAYVIEDVMYQHDLIVKEIKDLGYTNIKVYDSNVRDVDVDAHWLEHNVAGIEPKQYTKVSLKLIVVYRDLN